MPIPEAARPPKGQILAIGLAGGLLSGLLGVGGGVIMVPALVLWAGLGQREAHAISLGAIIPISAVGALTFAAAGAVALLPALLLAVGATLGASIGARLLVRIDERRLQRFFGAFLVIIAGVMAVQS